MLAFESSLSFFKASFVVRRRVGDVRFLQFLLCGCYVGSVRAMLSTYLPFSLVRLTVTCASLQF